ncbi:acyltransferase [Mesorhizobium sp. M1163]|uniref:acyltransferase family protein n=1 Tax=Mesorhizobium sp. M1163 TaxID=2957065 RepID=UPI00333BAB2F
MNRSEKHLWVRMKVGSQLSVMVNQTKEKEPRDRLDSLDSLRGISAILVVLFHVGWTSFTGELLFIKGGWVFVDLFFIISGFVISYTYVDKIKSHIDFQKFMTRRFFRIYPLHVFTFIAAYSTLVLGNLARGRGVNDGISGSALDVVASLFLVHGLGFSNAVVNVPSWSISTEFAVYLLFALVVLALTKRLTVAFLVLSGILSLVALCFLNYPRGIFTAMQFGLLRCLSGFSLGVLVFWLRSKSDFRLSGLASIGCYASSVMIIQIILLKFGSESTWNAVSLMPFAVLIYVSSIDESSPVKYILESRPLRFIGERSYSIYMLHTTILMIFSFLVTLFLPQIKSVGVETPYQHLLLGEVVNVAFLVVLIILSDITYRHIELPWRDYGRRASERLWVGRVIV